LFPEDEGQVHIETAFEQPLFGLLMFVADEKLAPWHTLIRLYYAAVGT